MLQYHQGGMAGYGGTMRDLARNPLQADEVLSVLRRGELITPAGGRTDPTVVVQSGGLRAGDRLRLVVGGREFDAYVDDRADQQIGRSFERVVHKARARSRLSSLHVWHTRIPTREVAPGGTETAVRGAP